MKKVTCKLFLLSWWYLHTWNTFCMIQRTRLRSTGLSTLKAKEKKAYVWTFGSVNNTMKYIAHQSSKIWSYVQKYYTNNGILCVKRMLSGGDKSVRWGGKQKRKLFCCTPCRIWFFWIGEQYTSLCCWLIQMFIYKPFSLLPLEVTALLTVA